MARKVASAPVVVCSVHFDPVLHGEVKELCAKHDWTVRAFTTRALREKVAAMRATG